MLNVRILISLICLILVSCTTPVSQNVYEGDIGVRIDGTAKMPVNVNPSFRTILKHDVSDNEIRPVDYMEPDTLYNLNPGQVWRCSEEPESHIQILSVDNETADIFLCVRGYNFSATVDIDDLQRTLVVKRKWYQD